MFFLNNCLYLLAGSKKPVSGPTWFSAPGPTCWCPSSWWCCLLASRNSPAGVMWTTSKRPSNQSCQRQMHGNISVGNSKRRCVIPGPPASISGSTIWARTSRHVPTLQFLVDLHQLSSDWWHAFVTQTVCVCGRGWSGAGRLGWNEWTRTHFVMLPLWRLEPVSEDRLCDAPSLEMDGKEVHDPSTFCV